MSLLKLILKVSILLSLSSSGLSQAQEQQPETNISTQNCPEVFYTLPLYPNAKFCQLFAEALESILETKTTGVFVQYHDNLLDLLD